MKKMIYLIVVLFCLFIGLWIAQDNPQVVAVRLLGFPLSGLSLGLWLLLALACGILAGLAATLPLLWRLESINRKLRREQTAPRQTTPN